MFLVDSSRSVGRKNFRKVQDFVSNIANELAIDSGQMRVGMATYGSQPKVGFYMDKYRSKEALRNGIYGVSYMFGETNTAAGLRLIRNRMFNVRRGDRPGVQNIRKLILILKN